MTATTVTAADVSPGETVTVALAVSYTRRTLSGGVQLTDEQAGVTVLLPADTQIGEVGR